MTPHPAPATTLVSATTATSRWLMPATLVPTALVFIWQAGLFGRWLVDDALISFAYARSLAEGAGYSQSVHDVPVEGASNPLWTALLAVLRLLGAFDAGRSPFGVEDYVLTIRVLAVVSMVAIQWILASALERRFPRRGAILGLVAGLVLALNAPFVTWAVSGLENPLYALGVAGLMAVVITNVNRETLAQRRVACLAALVALVAALTRPDGLAFVLVYPAAVILSRASGVRRARALATYALIFAIPYGTFIAWRRVTFGLWVPNTAVAKRQGFDLAMIGAHLAEVPQVLGLPLLVAVCAAAVTAFAVRVYREVVIVATVPFFLAMVVFAVLDTDWMPEYRFGTPLVVAAAALLALCAGVLATALPEVRWLRRVPLRAGGATLLAAAVALNAFVMVPRTTAAADDPTIPGCWITNRFGRMFNYYADRLQIESGSLLAPDLGGTLMTSRLRVFDLAGLTEPNIARFRNQRDFAGLRDYVMDELRPTFLHLDKAWKAGLDKDPRLGERYTALGSSDDWVLTEVIPPGTDLVGLRRDGVAVVVQLRAERDQNPRMGCGALVIGSPDPAWTSSQTLPIPR